LLALVLQYLYGIRGERLLMEQLNYNLLFRWFVGLNADEPVWVPTVFTKNRERLLERKIATRFLEQVVSQARAQKLTSNEHFSADGTLLKAWASQKSFRRKDDDDSDKKSGGGDFHGEKRSNKTHQSTTDPDARLYRKGRNHESRMAYLGHVVIENRNGLVVGAEVTLANGRGERRAAVELMSNAPRATHATLGADKAYDTADFVEELRQQDVVPHVAQNVSNRSSAIDARTTRHAGYAASQICRRAVERPFAWAKAAAGIAQVKHRGRHRVDWIFTMAVYEEHR
jgi:IS5 family transposase